MKEKSPQRQKNRWGIKTSNMFEVLDLYGIDENVEVAT